MSTKNIIILFFIPTFLLIAQYQDLRFHHITTDNGLSKSSVTCILQDKQGFMWIGTFNGLNRYGGYNFTVYQYDQNDPQSISHNYISSILEDHEGQLWVGTSDGLNCYNRSTDNFKHYRHSNSDSKSINDNQIESIFEDSKGRLWIGTRNGGLDLLDRSSGSFTHNVYNKNEKNSLSSNFVRTIFEDSNKNIWIGHRNGAIDVLYDKHKIFKHLSYQGGKLTTSSVMSIVESPDKNIWVGTQGDGLFRIQANNNSILIVAHYLHNTSQQTSIVGNIILSLMIDHNGKLWIGTEDEGLNILDIPKGKFYSYKTDPLEYSSLNNNSIYTIFEDNIGNIWLGTYAGGVNLLTGGRAYFQYYKHITGNNNSLIHNNINSFWEDEERNIWIATGGKGLDFFDRQNKKFIHYNNNKSSIAADVILSLYEDESNNLWIGTWANGLYQFNRKTKKITQFTKEKNGLGSNNIFGILEGKNGELWLCTFWGGLTCFNTKSQSSVVYNTENSDLSDNDLRTITKDFQGNFWIGTDVGLDYFNPETKVFRSYQHKDDNKNSLSKGFVTYILESKDAALWIGTTGGLNKFDRKTNSFKHYNVQNGLANDEVMCIVEDDSGFLWISTNKGISKFNPKSGVFKNYDASDGLQGNEFNARSGTKTRQGEIIFGGNNGFNIFQPEELKSNPFIPPVIINDLKIFNKPVPIGGQDSPLVENIIDTKELVFSYKQSVFSFGFVALNYTSPEKNQYAYMMEGFDHDWNYVGSSRTATYTNLDPGNYIFRVKASNNDGIWNEKGASILITIEPPFWKTWWAYTIESIFVLMIAYFILNYYTSRQKLRNALKMEHLELEKMYENDQMKNQFFSNISHEFHSPMTLILSPLAKLITSSSLDDKIKNSLTLVYRNATRLQRMADQLKDLNKLETGDLRLNLSKGDLIHFINEIYHSFQDYAKDHHIDFQFQSNKDEHVAWFDSDKLDKIIYNLLSNAFKFTKDQGEIAISVSVVTSERVHEYFDGKDKPSRYIEISVKDNGIGIPKDKTENIFKRYYHLEDYNGKQYEGSGVGLAFVYELIRLYKGEISFNSTEGVGTTFTVQIPIDEHFLEENQLVGKFKITPANHNASSFSSLPAQETHIPELVKSKNRSRDIPVILIVEDDNEIRDYLKQYFDDNYRVLEAENGTLGCQKAIQNIPDLIITDIKMDEIDGIELCKKLKHDEKTSHIPIIMLTSYSSREYQIRGLSEGADAYLTKPFNIDVLEAQMINLLDTRKKLQEKFRSEFVLGPSKIPVSDIDEKFLKRLTDIVEEHMSDEKFNADILSEKIGMSRMQLYRKLRGLTNQTVHEFIRNIRLKRAVQLLEQKRMTITEVAYAVGFNDLTYFARCFRKQYDKSPSEYISNKS
jgi:ligand-binding sensor domain-containing protein/signal transduction histidine kinase/DNA-binding response OmpR family regulator